MLKLLKNKKNKHSKQTNQSFDDSRTHLRDFLTTLKYHKVNRSMLISENHHQKIKTSELLNYKSLDNKTKQEKSALPSINNKRKLSLNKRFNEFQEHIIFNYLNAHIGIKKNSNSENKFKKKISKIHKLKNIKKKELQMDNKTIQQAQLQTIGNQKDIFQAHKEYSLRDEPMKHYISQREQRKKRQWKQNNILQLETCFYIFKKKEKLLSQNSINQNSIKNEFKKIKIPESKDILDFIKHYKAKSKQINIAQLIQKPNFHIDFGNDHLYFGQIQNSKRHGHGVYITEFSKFQGQWKDDQKINGIQINQKGQYKGQFKDDKRHGKGQLIWNNGEIYSGQWSKGKKHGIGIWTSPKGDSYMGQWNKGVVEGQGVHQIKNGQKYQGSFKNFLKDGWGKQKFPNKDVYEGQYLNGLPHGKGTYNWSSGQTYIGTFYQGYRHGNGILTSNNGFHYNGNFVKEMAQGNCEIDYGNGQLYSGLIKNGRRNGKGILRNIKLRKLQVGQWQNDELILPNI